MVDGDFRKEFLTLTFETDKNEAEARAVGASIIAMGDLVSQINSIVDKEQKVLVKARPFAKGSLEIPLDLIITSGAGYYLLKDHPLFEKMKGIIQQVFDIKTNAKGKTITVKNGTVIVGDNNQIDLVDPAVAECLKPACESAKSIGKAFTCINEDDSIKGVRITSSDKKLNIRIPRHDFRYHSLCGDSIVDHQEYTRTAGNERLIIRSLVFEKGLSWGFKWRNSNIMAVIEDESFMDGVLGGLLSFKVGDSLDVVLKYVDEYDIKKDETVAKKFKIIRVNKHSHTEDQAGLFDG